MSKNDQDHICSITSHENVVYIVRKWIIFVIMGQKKKIGDALKETHAYISKAKRIKNV